MIALMPGGDHLNIIDPPGLTVMRIAGGRYRVTAAHRVVWTWMNEFAALTDPFTVAAHRAATAAAVAAKRRTSTGRDDDDEYYDGDEEKDDVVGGKVNLPVNSNDATVNTLHVGDLVTMTIVDVFETDNRGKLLSYCPTFDNRAITKTHATTETLRKSSSQLLTFLGRAQKSKTATTLVKQARSVTHILRRQVDAAVQNMAHGPSPSRSNNSVIMHTTNDTDSTSRSGTYNNVLDLVHKAENLFLHRNGNNNNNNISSSQPSRMDVAGDTATSDNQRGVTMINVLSPTDETEDGTQGEYSYTASSTVTTGDDSMTGARPHRSTVTTSTSYLGDDDTERHEV
jgi:hypothetical protein